MLNWGVNSKQLTNNIRSPQNKVRVLNLKANKLHYPYNTEVLL